MGDAEVRKVEFFSESGARVEYRRDEQDGVVWVRFHRKPHLGWVVSGLEWREVLDEKAYQERER